MKRNCFGRHSKAFVHWAARGPSGSPSTRPLARILVSRIRRGEFSVQAHIDLHGMIQPDAKEALNQFILASVRKGHRAVLVVHGRGLRSPGGQPVLKHAAAQWLSHGTIGGYVLAFATARAYDGGAGAMWVLLRRERRRARFDVLQGAKRRD